MRKVIFLDRDGVINKERGTYTFLPEHFEYTPNFWQNCKQMQSWGYDFIIITNQGGIAKKLYGKKEVELLNDKILQDAKVHGVQVLAIYYCPHHNEIESCYCRKPNNLMLEKACAKYGVDKQQSYFIGDSQRDIDAALKTDITGILIPKNVSLTSVFDRISHG